MEIEALQENVFPLSEKRLLDAGEVAFYLGVDLTHFKSNRIAFEVLGFPAPLKMFGRWDKRAVDAWLDAQSGLKEMVIENATGPAFRTRLRVHPRNRCPPAQPPRVAQIVGVGDQYTVAGAIADYLATFTGARNSYRNSKYYAESLILPEFGNARIVDLAADEIRTWHRNIAKSPPRIRCGAGTSPRYRGNPADPEAIRKRRSTANRVLTVLKAALNVAYRDGRVPSDDAWRRVQPFPRVAVGPGAYLSPEQCVRLVDYCAPDFRRLVQAALLTGARFAELSNLVSRDFDRQSGSVFIHKSKTRRPRHVILTDEGREFFAALTLNRCPMDTALVREDGKQWYQTDPYPRLDSACKLAKISPRVTFHQLRHTYASILAMNGAPMAVIAKNLGHTSTEACEKYYAHLAPSYVSEVIRDRMPRLGIVS